MTEQYADPVVCREEQETVHGMLVRGLAADGGLEFWVIVQVRLGMQWLASQPLHVHLDALRNHEGGEGSAEAVLHEAVAQFLTDTGLAGSHPWQ